MRYYDLKIWHPTDEKDQAAADKNVSSFNVRKSLQESSAPKRTPVVANKYNLHLSSYLIQAENRMDYSPGGSPLTGTFDPGSLDISFQISETDFANPMAGGDGAFITIRGVDPKTISQASKLTGATVELKGGMGHGLPFAKPQQAGTLLYGTVQSAFGNWENTDLSLTLFVTTYLGGSTEKAKQMPDGRTEEPKVVYTFKCEKGKPLKPAIEQALKGVVPGVKVHFSTPHNPIATGEVAGMYRSFKALCVALGDAWEKMTPKEGARIAITPVSGEFFCSEAFSDATPKVIGEEDLIGQPTWNGPTDITFCCPLRGDLAIDDVVTLPDAANIGGKIAPQDPLNLIQPYKRADLFSGKFVVRTVNHIGQFRSPDGMQWMTSVDCYPAIR